MNKTEYALIGAVATAIVGASASVYSFVRMRNAEKKVAQIQEKLDDRTDDIIKRVSGLGDDTVKNAKEATEELTKRLERKIDGLSNTLNIDIPDYVAEEALKRAAEKESSAAIEKASKKIMEEYVIAIRSEVRKSVDLAYANTKVDVKNELSKKISDIDISGIKREVMEEARRKVENELEDALDEIKEKKRKAEEEIDDAIEEMKDDLEEEIEKAKETATEKFEDELDTITTKFSNDLERGSKIYKAISDKLGT